MLLWKNLRCRTRTLKTLTLVILLAGSIAALISGGADTAYADTYNEYTVYITKEGTKRQTKMKILAKSEDEAIEHAVLNGWSVLKVQLKEKPAQAPPPEPEQKAEPEVSAEVKALRKATLDFNTDYGLSATIYFPLSESTTEITPEVLEKLKNVQADKKYIIIGHTDTVHVEANPEYRDNFELSVQRAEFLRDKIVNFGADAENIKIHGFGPLFPAAVNKEEGQPLNRRAELYERK